jgi:hypothetical protein
MAKIITTQYRKRGIFGKIFKWGFVLFNLLMALWFFGGLISVGGQVATETDTARQVGGAIGATIGLTAILGLWLVGDLILGVLALATRGKIVTIEQRAEQ